MCPCRCCDILCTCYFPEGPPRDGAHPPPDATSLCWFKCYTSMNLTLWSKSSTTDATWSFRVLHKLDRPLYEQIKLSSCYPKRFMGRYFFGRTFKRFSPLREGKSEFSSNQKLRSQRWLLLASADVCVAVFVIYGFTSGDGLWTLELCMLGILTLLYMIPLRDVVSA